MKKIIILSFLLFSISSYKNSDTDNYFLKIKDKAKQALKYCKENNLNTDLCILVDMDIHSGKNRLFVYDFNTDSVLNSALCSHGCCASEWGTDLTKEFPLFSNVPDSHCSSLGKYKIGKRGYSNWGININYKLHGLEKTNNNAFSRVIVLHSWDMITDYEVFPEGTPEGWGCPSVSNNQMKYLDKLLKKTKS